MTLDLSLVSRKAILIIGDGVVMNVLLFTAKHTESGKRLKDCIESLHSLESLTDCWHLTELTQRFELFDPLPEVVVLQAAKKQDLAFFTRFRSRLEQVFFILILPDAESDTVASGHQLRPRFIAYQDSDFAEVRAVLDQLHAKHDREARLKSVYIL